MSPDMCEPWNSNADKSELRSASKSKQVNRSTWSNGGSFSLGRAEIVLGESEFKAVFGMSKHLFLRMPAHK